MVEGAVKIHGETLKPGDAAALTHEDHPSMEAVGETEILFFDLA